MVEDLSSWVKQVILVVMFASFVDFLIPENKFLKYTKIFLGLVVMIAMINPVLVFLKKDYSLDDASFIYQDLTDTQVLSTKIEKMEAKTDEIVILEYKERLRELLTSEIARMTDLSIENIKVQIVEDMTKREFGSIESIYIAFGKQKTGDDDISDVKRIYIDKIRFREDITDTPIKSHKDTSGELEKIKNFLISKYEVSEEKVHLAWEE